MCRCGVGFPPAELSRYGKPVCVREMQPNRVRIKITPMLNNSHLTRLNSITKGDYEGDIDIFFNTII